MVGNPVSGRDTQALIRLAPGAENVGLAVMLADLIRQNLEQNPGKWADFDRLDALVCLEARDADVTVTLVFAHGTLIIHEGCGNSVIRISAAAKALLALPAVRIVAGFPYLFGSRGRGLRRGLLSGRVRIAGMLLRPVQLIRFTRLISVGR
jgi:hypothetical protein